MRKKYLSAILFGALAIATTGSISSCKDYDDDINDLQEQINKKAAADELTTQLGTLTSTINSVKSDAATALSKANDAAAAAGVNTKAIEAANTAIEALKKADTDATAAINAAKQAAIDAALAADTKVAKDAAEALKKAIDGLADKYATIVSVDEKIEAAKAELKALIASGASQEDFDNFSTKVDKLIAEVSNLAGHRLSSLALIPYKHINGIPAITLTSLTYTPQAYVAYTTTHPIVDGGTHTTMPWLDHAAVAAAKPRVISGVNYAYYHVNPSLGVRPQDIANLEFTGIQAQNETRAEGEVLNNEPISVIPGEVSITNGVLKVPFRRSESFMNKPIVGTEMPTTNPGSATDNPEHFYMASLKASIAEAQWTSEEKEAGVPVYVNSEYNRIGEKILVPYIVNSKTDFSKPIGTNFADEKQTLASGEDIYVHYHDSVCLYASDEKQLIDVNAPYNKALDLKTLVSVCGTEVAATDHSAHVAIPDYKSYGLTYRFYLATKPYLIGTRETDEQSFGKIDNPQNGMLSSRVYTVGDDSKSRTAIGREPIVRAELIDTVNGNALVALRYIKIRWTEIEVPAQVLDPITFADQPVTCEAMYQQLFTQDMNEKIYHMVKYQTSSAESTTSMSEAQFHAIYDEIEITELLKDGKSIFATVDKSSDVATYWDEGAKPQVMEGDEKFVTPIVGTPTDNEGDVVFGYLVDGSGSNRSYNLVWAMNPAAVGTLKDGGSTFEITVKYKNTAGMYGAITQKFIQKIVLPAQEFTYQATYWKNGVGQGTFNVNPVVFSTTNDGWVSAPTVPHDYSTCALKDYSHIEADLVNGYIYAPSKAKPTSLAQYIKYIRGCANVYFAFDKANFGKYDYLKNFNVDAAETTLYEGPAATPLTAVNTVTGTIPDPVIDDDTYLFDYVQDTNIAASISNLFGATGATNADPKLFPWNFNEPLGSGIDEASAIIRLHELDQKNGTTAAIKLVDKAVPVKLVVEYNAYNKVAVQKFDVFFINPLTVDGQLGDNFVDAVIDGSFLNVSKNFTFTDWNFYKVAAAAAVAAPGTTIPEKEQFTHELYDYYAVKSVAFDTKNVKTNLKLVDSHYQATEGVKDGILPTNVSLKQMTWDETTAKSTAVEVTADPTHLAYFNNAGTPVDVDYKMYLNASVSYKWGVMEKGGLEVKVAKAAGTPSVAP